MSGRSSGAFDEVYAIVRGIPAGRVMTYGQVSEIMDRRISPAAVGWALSQCPADVPWQRIVNGKGGCSTGERQIRRLRKEGIKFRKGALDLSEYRFSPRSI